MDMALRYELTVFRVVSNQDELTRDEMCPKSVLVKEFPEVPAYVFWKGWEEEEKRHNEKKKKRQQNPSSKNQQKRKAEAAPAEPSAPKKRALRDADDRDDKGPDDLAADPDEEDAFEAEAHLLLEDKGNAEDTASEADSIPWSELSGVLSEQPDGEEDDASKSKPSSARPEAPAGEPSHSDAAEIGAQEDHHMAARGPDKAPRKEPQSTTLLRFEEHGDLRYNKEDEHIMAVCKYHHGCRKTRTVHAPTGAKLLSNPGQGRPVGLLCAWLMCGKDHTSAESHKAESVLRGISFDDRRKARRECMTMAGASEFVCFERARSSAEAEDEPAVVA